VSPASGVRPPASDSGATRRSSGSSSWVISPVKLHKAAQTISNIDPLIVIGTLFALAYGGQILISLLELQ
jgi:hypothetical protein